MDFSPNARAIMDDIARTYVSQNYPSYPRWMFARPETDTTFPELANGHRLIRRIGNYRPERYVLTAAGHHWIMSNRSTDK